MIVEMPLKKSSHAGYSSNTSETGNYGNFPLICSSMYALPDLPESLQLIQKQNTALYAFAYFLPVILKDGFGYSTAKAQVMTFPPYLVGGVV